MPQPNRYRRNTRTLQKNLQTMQKPHRMRTLPFVAAGIILLAIPAFFVFKLVQENDKTPNNAEQSTPSFDKTQFSLDDPTSPWVVVNKQRPLQPKTYTPTGLRAPTIKLKGGKTAESMLLKEEASRALETLNEAAHELGHQFVLVSGYRAHGTQKTIYDSEVRGFGQAIADQESARPGHSEHQTGWAADVVGISGDCEIEACFADTPEGQWLAANAHKYGFVIRYAPDKTNVTGYIYEPWHLRYVGIDLAEEMYRSGIQTPEEFFELPAAPNY